MKSLRKAILKQLLAVALGGACTALAGAKIDPDHLGASLKELGKLAATGSAIGVIGLNARAPKDD